MSFKLSSKVNSETVFLIKKSEIGGRLDPMACSPQLRKINLRIQKSPYPLEQLCLIAQFVKQVVNNLPSEYKYVGLENIISNSGEFQDTKVKNNICSGFIFKKEQILFPKLRPYLNKVYFAEFDGICSTEFHVLDSLSIDNKYLSIFLSCNIIAERNRLLMTGNTLPRLQTEDVRKLRVPIPPLNIQKDIVSKMKSAYAEKKSKEAQAQELLDSIDAYMLGELGITLPEKKEHTIKERIFYRKLSEVAGNRFDPKKHGQNIRNLKSAIKSSPYKKGSLKKLVTHNCSGEWGVDVNVVDNSNLLKKCLVIRSTEFDNDFNLNIDNSRIKYRQINKSILKGLDIQANDLLIEKSGGSPDQPVGRIALITSNLLQNNTICFSNFIQKIRIDESSIHPEYLFNYLKTIHNIKLTDSMQSQTSGIRNLIMQEYFNQDIVLPDKKTQKRIYEKIRAIRNRAKKLQKEAIEGLEKAKSEIEALILGEAKA